MAAGTIHPKRLASCAIVVLALSTGPAQAHDIVRHGGPYAPVATSVMVPAGTDLLFLSGVLPDVADEKAPVGSVDRLGDTETQVRSVLGKLERELESAGYTMADVVKMTVFLVGDARKGGTMDFDGLMKGYMRYFGIGMRDKVGPARTTVQVAGLPVPGALVEIEVVAARHAAH